MSGARMVIVLLVIGVISGGLLAGVYGVANPLIIKNREKALKEAVLVVLPDAKSFKKIEKRGVVVYQGIDAGGKRAGRAFIAEGNGFQGNIRMMVGMDDRFDKVKGLFVIENVETPGLGNKIAETSFQDQFRGLMGTKEILYVKNQTRDLDENQIEAITGATISSKAVVDNVNTQIAAVRRAFGAGE